MPEFCKRIKPLDLISSRHGASESKQMMNLNMNVNHSGRVQFSSVWSGALLFNGKRSQPVSFHGWFPVPSVLLWKWVRVRVWERRWTYGSTGWVAVWNMRKWTFPVFLIHQLLEFLFRKQKCCPVRACGSCSKVKNHHVQTMISPDCHHTSRRSLTWLLVNSV